MTHLRKHFRLPPLQTTQERGTHCVGNASEIKKPGPPAPPLVFLPLITTPPPQCSPKTSYNVLVSIPSTCHP